MTNQVELRTLKQGEFFKRKAESETVYIREHYNRKDQFGPATFCCTRFEDINREIQLKPTAMVFVGFTF